MTPRLAARFDLDPGRPGWRADEPTLTPAVALARSARVGAEPARAAAADPGNRGATLVAAAAADDDDDALRDTAGFPTASAAPPAPGPAEGCPPGSKR